MTHKLNILTHSAESTFKTCPRKFYLRYRLGLTPSHDSDALRIGSAYHAGLEAYKVMRDGIAAINAVSEMYASMACPPWLTQEDYDTEREIALAMVAGHIGRYASDIIIKPVAVELTFDLPIRNPQTGRVHEHIRNQGKIDEIGELPDGRLALVEHKTTGDQIGLDSDYWRRCRMDSQISRYYAAAHELGYPVSTVIYDVARKPSIRPKAIAKADRAMATSLGRYFDVPLLAACPERETPELFGARLRDDIAKRPDFYFMRAEIPRLDSDLADYADEQWQITQQIASCERYGRYYRNTTACTQPYRCTFFDVCSNHTIETLSDHNFIPDGFKRSGVLHPELVSQETVA